MEDEQKYLEEILARLCPKCIDGDGQGNCLLAAGAECMMKRFFPQVVEAVRSVYSTSMEPYEAALRKKVCSDCVQQLDGNCVLRDGVECALDRYFPVIVQTVEDLDLARRFASPKTAWA